MKTVSKITPPVGRLADLARHHREHAARRPLSVPACNVPGPVWGYLVAHCKVCQVADLFDNQDRYDVDGELIPPTAS